MDHTAPDPTATDENCSPLDELELLNDIRIAERQIEEGLTIPHEQFREELLRRFAE
jgi:hypothetical protein